MSFLLVRCFCFLHFGQNVRLGRVMAHFPSLHQLIAFNFFIYALCEFMVIFKDKCQNDPFLVSTHCLPHNINEPQVIKSLRRKQRHQVLTQTAAASSLYPESGDIKSLPRERRHQVATQREATLSSYPERGDIKSLPRENDVRSRPRERRHQVHIQKAATSSP